MKPERIASWWIHWNDLNWPDDDNLDKIKARAEGYAKANVSAAMIFGTHFRWDWMPFFPLLHDYLATVTEELHKYGVKVFDHHSVNLIHRYNTREEMRHVMRDSGPHLPFSPTWEAAKTWQYNGKYLNDWRMIDVTTGKPAYFSQYTGEGFCHRNPEFKEAYQHYIKNLIADTGIDGLSADDGMHYLRYNTCGCKHCRAELKKRTGIDLPPIEDRSFWFNWDNPAWHAWMDVRFDSTGEFYRDLAKVLPENFMLTACGSSSASAHALELASDARQFVRGCNYVNMEMSGNTPPYKHDPKTINASIPYRMSNACHHQAVARENNTRAFNTGFAFSEVAANHVWAVSKTLNTDAWIGTLKTRLGLPWHILNTIPNEQDIVGRAFGFEKNHPELFGGEILGQVGVYFSYETRNHTLFGALDHGYAKDYQNTVTMLLRNHISPHTVFAFPETAKDYPVILVSSVARMTDEEKVKMDRYLKSGGKLIVTGPAVISGCEADWNLPNIAPGEPKDMFIRFSEDGCRVLKTPWIYETPLPETSAPDAWTEIGENIFYHPQRMDMNRDAEAVAELCGRFMKQSPIEVPYSKGYLCSVVEDVGQTIVHFLAEDYDVDINHELDEIRYHRSRVNLVTHVEPIGIDRVIEIKAEGELKVYTPFQDEEIAVEKKADIYRVTLPEKCSYAIFQFRK